MRRLLFAVCLAALLPGCGGDDGAPGSTADGKTRFVLDLSAALDDPAHFYDAPYPFDLRLDPDQHPMVAGFPNPNQISVLDGLIDNAQQATGFPMIPVVWMRFTGPLAPRSVDDLIAADVTSPIFLIDVDPASKERGRTFPVVAQTLLEDPYSPANVLAIAPRPGFVLRPHTTYAVVVRQSALTESGEDIAENPVLARLSRRAPRGAQESAADTVFAPLWETLANPRQDVAAATVFTTGDVVSDQLALSDAVLDKYDVSITDLAAYDDPEVTEVCILQATVEYPQFQTGTPPYQTGGRFEMGSDGAPVEQRTELAPVKIILPKTPMPASGYPLIINIHGSGGYSIAMVRPLTDLTHMPGERSVPRWPTELGASRWPAVRCR